MKLYILLGTLVNLSPFLLIIAHTPAGFTLSYWFG